MAERKRTRRRVHNCKNGAREGFTGKDTFEQRPGGDEGYRERASQVEGRGCLACADSRTQPICQERRPKIESSGR